MADAKLKFTPLAEQLEDLRAMCHLKEGEYRAYDESCEYDEQGGTRILTTLLQDNQRKRLLRAQHNHNDHERDAIRSAFPEKEHRKTCLALERHIVQKAQGEVEEAAHGGRSVYDRAVHHLEVRQKKLVELQQELQQIKLTSSNYKITDLENARDEAYCRIDQVLSDGTRNESMLRKLREERCALPGNLDEMEITIKTQQKEIAEHENLLQASERELRHTARELAMIERDSWKKRRQRDVKMTKSRKEAQKQQGDADTATQKRKRTMLLFDNREKVTKPGESQENIEHVKDLEETLRHIQDAANVTSPDDVIPRMHGQQEKLDHLNAQVHDVDAQQRRLLQDREGLRQELYGMKYTGECERSKAKDELEEKQGGLNQEVDTGSLLDQKTKPVTRTLRDVSNGFTSLLNRLTTAAGISLDDRNLSLQPIASGNTLAGENHIRICTRKIKQLQKHVCSHPVQAVQSINAEQMQKNMVDHIPEDNLRINLKKPETNYRDDFQHEDEHLRVSEAEMRMEVKYLSAKFVDDKLGRKKPRANRKPSKTTA